jgi:hypothetical protein
VPKPEHVPPRPPAAAEQASTCAVSNNRSPVCEGQHVCNSFTSPASIYRLAREQDVTGADLLQQRPTRSPVPHRPLTTGKRAVRSGHTMSVRMDGLAPDTVGSCTRAVTMRTRVAATPACPDHACDSCRSCRSGRCSGKDRPLQVRFGDTGMWEGPVFGQFGVLETDEDGRLQCHICGEWRVSVAAHSSQAHRISADEYRALFGLRADTGLVGPGLRARLQQLAAENLTGYSDQLKTIPRPVPRGYHWRLESRLDPANRRAWEAFAQTHGEQLARNLDGIRQSRREAATVTCVICQKVFANRNQGRRARVCSQACDRERRRRLLLADPISERPGMRDKLSRAIREHWARNREPLIETVRGRGWQAGKYAEVAARLSVVDPAAFDALRARDAEIVRRYYGLQRGHPETIRALAEAFGVSTTTITVTLRRGVSRLLGWTAIDPNRRLEGVCEICGTAVSRAVRRQSYACSAACMTELRRRITTAAAKRWGWPRADELRALPPTSLERLTELERQLVAAYYGLDGRAPQTQRAVSRRFKMDDKRVAQVINGAVQRLLGGA